MIEWLASGIPAAVEASGPRFMSTLLQILTFGGAMFGGGLFFGRFWLTRMLTIKDTALEAQKERYEALSERVVLANDQLTFAKQSIESADNLDDAKETAKDIPSLPVKFDIKLTRKSVREFLKRHKLERNLSSQHIADEIGITLSDLEKFMKSHPISKHAYDKIHAYALKW